MPTKVHKKKDGTLYVKRSEFNKRKDQQVSKKKAAAIAKKVVSNNLEMLKRQVGPITVGFLDGNYSDGDPTTLYKGLNARGPFNFILNPLNYGWENDQSSDTQDHFTGKGIHPRYLKQRFLFKFPEGAQSIINPMRVQLVWGFCKRPAMLTEYTTPTAREVSRRELEDLFKYQVEPDWNSSTDQLAFRTKRPSNYIVTGKKWIKPDRRHRIGLPQAPSVYGTDAILGAPPDILETIQWKMGKEWRLEKSNSDEYESDVYHYNNEQWAPFVVIYNPDYCNVKQASGSTCGGGETGNPVPEVNRIQVQHVSCMWYNDA